MIGVTSLPIGKYHDPWPQLPDNARHFKLIFPGVLYTAVRNIQGLSPADTQNSSGVGGLALAIFCCTPCAHLSPGQVQDTRPTAQFRHFEHSPTAGLFDVITVSSNGKNIERETGHV